MTKKTGNGFDVSAIVEDIHGKTVAGHVENIFHLRNWKNVENKPVTCCELVDFLYSASMIGKQSRTEY